MIILPYFSQKHNINYKQNTLLVIINAKCYNGNVILKEGLMIVKKAYKLFAYVFAFILLTQTASAPASAFESMAMTREEWNTYYNSLCNENTLPTLCTGADETQLNITWHAGKKTAQAKVQVSDNVLMQNAVTFTGEIVDAENEEQVVCRVVISGIEENSTYYYRLHTGEGFGKTYKYESKGFNNQKALVVGDIQIGGQQDNTEEQSRVGYNWLCVLDEALSKNQDISYLISPGDNTSTGKTANEWQTLLMPPQLRSLPMALAIGNHDKKGFSYNHYTFMPNEYYGRYFEGLDRDFWFCYGDVLYLFFDATSGSAYDHFRMAKEAVDSNPNAKWRIAVMHQALYGAGYSAFDPETMLLLNGVFQPIYDMFDVDLVLTGHSHAQGRSHFIRSGAVVGLAESGGTYNNPRGTVYLNSNAVCNQAKPAPIAPWLAYSFKESDVAAYSTLEFTEGSLSVKTLRGDNSELLDSITINKTKDFNNSYKFSVKRLFYFFVEALGLLYMKIDALVVRIRGGHF